MPQKQAILQSDLYRPGDELDIIAVNRMEYGPADIVDFNVERFIWLYTNNPAGSTTICVVRDNRLNQVVGSVWIMPLQMFMFGQDYVVAKVTRLLIHPDYRNTLAYVKLARRRDQEIQQKDFPFRFSFLHETYFERIRHVERLLFFCVPLLVRPLNMVQLAQTRFKQRWLQFGIGWGGKLAAPLLFRTEAQVAPQSHLEISWIDQFDERFDAFWERVRGKYSVMAVRDRTYLSWRFPQDLGYTYRVLTATINDELVGYLVLSCPTTVRDIPSGLIMDILLEPSERGVVAGKLLLAQAWRHFQEKKVWLAGGLALPHTDEYRVMQLAGYRSCPQRLAPSIFRVAFQSYDSTLPDATHIKASDWFLTSADYPTH